MHELRVSDLRSAIRKFTGVCYSHANWLLVFKISWKKNYTRQHSINRDLRSTVVLALRKNSARNHERLLVTLGGALLLTGKTRSLKPHEHYINIVCKRGGGHKKVRRVATLVRNLSIAKKIPLWFASKMFDPHNVVIFSQILTQYQK